MDSRHPLQYKELKRINFDCTQLYNKNYAEWSVNRYNVNFVSRSSYTVFAEVSDFVLLLACLFCFPFPHIEQYESNL